MLHNLLQVALGGAIGASGRYLVNVSAMRLMGPGFPWATLAVNVAGSFLMGVLVVVLAHKDGGMRMAPLLMTGMLGGFTTFSAFSLEVANFVRGGDVTRAVAYALLSVTLGLMALFLGLWLARKVFA